MLFLQAILLILPFLIAYLIFYVFSSSNRKSLSLKDTNFNRLYLLFAELEEKSNENTLKRYSELINTISGNSKSENVSKFEIFDQIKTCSNKLNLFLIFCERKEFEMIKILFEYFDAKELMLKSQDQNGLYVFQRSCYKGDLEMVKCLIEISRKYKFSQELFSLKSRDGFTGFHLSVSKGNKIVVEYLMEQNEIKETFLEEEDNQGNTPFIISW